MNVVPTPEPDDRIVGEALFARALALFDSWHWDCEVDDNKADGIGRARDLHIAQR